MRTLSPWVLPPLGDPLVARSVRSVGRASVRPLSPSLGYRLAGKFVAFFESANDGQISGLSIFPEGQNRAPADWSSSSVALPVDSLADEPVGG